MNNKNPAYHTVNHLKSYINLKLDILLLSISKKLSNAAGYFVFAIIIGFIALFISLFLSLSLSEWLADVLNMPGMGNLIVSLIYIILGLIIYKFREKLIITPVSRNIEKLMDMSDLHKESSISTDKSIDESLDILKGELIVTENNIEENLNNVKSYFSYEEMKGRFFQSLFNNPKGIINALLIFKEMISNRKKKK